MYPGITIEFELLFDVKVKDIFEYSAIAAVPLCVIVQFDTNSFHCSSVGKVQEPFQPKLDMEVLSYLVPSSVGLLAPTFIVAHKVPEGSLRSAYSCPLIVFCDFVVCKPATNSSKVAIKFFAFIVILCLGIVSAGKDTNNK